MVWYSHLFQSFLQFVVIHTVKGFAIVNKAEVDIFWNSCFFDIPKDVGSFITFIEKIFFLEVLTLPFPLPPLFFKCLVKLILLS